MPQLVLYDKQESIWFEKRKHVRNLLFVGGIQCGKTTLGAAWINRVAIEIGKECGFKGCQDTLIIAAPTYKVLTQATLPKFLSMAGRMGEYKKSDSLFQYNWGLTVYLRTATKPESMEGISNCRAAWLDEGGMVSRYFYENVTGRVARLEGPVLTTTTPYAMNWAAELADGALKKTRDDTLLVQVRSVDSPYFPQAEYDRQAKLLDPRRFMMKYAGQFGKMQGLVFPSVPMVMSHPLPPGTKYYGGLDWGHTDPFVLVVRAVTPDQKHYRVAEYYKVGLIASEMFGIVKSYHALYHFENCWADPSRPEYILELGNEGIPVTAGNNEIRLGIDRHTQLMRENRFEVFEDMNPHGKDEYETYHYPEPEERGFDDDQKEQNPVDANNHGIDADRYCTMGILEDVGMGVPGRVFLPSQRDGISVTPQDRLEKLKRRSRVTVL